MASELKRLFSVDFSKSRPGERLRVPLPASRADAAALAQAAVAARARGERFVVVCADPADVHRLAQEMSWFEPSLDVRPMPDWETLPYDVLSPQEELVSERLETLYRLTTPSGGADVLLASAVTASQRLAPVAYIGANTFFFKKGERISIEKLRENLVQAGYAAVKQVLAAGEFAVRGSIVDVFPMGSEKPFRLDLFDDEIDEIRWFDVETQRSMESVEEIRLLPGHEFPVDPESMLAFRQRWRTRFPSDPKKSLVYKDAEQGILSPGIEYYLPLFFDETATLADYLPELAKVVLVGDVEKALHAFMKDMASREKVLATDPVRPPLKPEELWLTPEDFFVSLNKFARFSVLRTPDEAGAAMLTDVGVDRKNKNPIAKLLEYADKARALKTRVLIVASSPGRMETMSELFKAGGPEVPRL